MALKWIERAIGSDPSVSEFHNAMGVVLRRQGRGAEAIAAYHHAITLQPTNANALYNLGNLLQEHGRLIEAAAVYRTAIARSESGAAYYNLGNVVWKLGDLDAAAAALRRATELRPNHSSSHNNLGIVLQLCGELDGAMASFQRAAACEPSHAHHFGNFIYAGMFHPAYDSAAMLAHQRAWNLRYATPFRPTRKEHSNVRSPNRPLRIGYVCGDFRNHVLGLYVLPLLEGHDRRQFTICCYSNVTRPDAITDRFKALATQWCDIADLSDDSAADMIRADRVDILVDLALHMSDNRLLIFARKPAPVQVSFGGYPGGTGLETIEYRLTDPYLDPPGSDGDYLERSVRLPSTFWCYAPLGEEPSVNELPALSKGFVTFGCLNNFCKVNDGVLHLWAKVLSAVVGSQLLLSAPEGSARQRVTQRLLSLGIDPSRIQFAGWLRRPRYLQLFNQIDISLDTLPYNGHTTSLDSFYMGVPVITRIGKTAPGRAGWSQLSNLGLTELAALNQEQFIQIATTLAADLAKLAEMRSNLRHRMERSPLMDAGAFTRGIEQSYRNMWATWCERTTANSVTHA
jgi:predicted O-linked N-acetylglucosamine transferase (SPINDLY family)